MGKRLAGRPRGKVSQNKDLGGTLSPASGLFCFVCPYFIVTPVSRGWSGFRVPCGAKEADSSASLRNDNNGVVRNDNNGPALCRYAGRAGELARRAYADDERARSGWFGGSAAGGDAGFGAGGWSWGRGTGATAGRDGGTNGTLGGRCGSRASRRTRPPADGRNRRSRRRHALRPRSLHRRPLPRQVLRVRHGARDSVLLLAGRRNVDT